MEPNSGPANLLPIRVTWAQDYRSVHISVFIAGARNPGAALIDSQTLQFSCIGPAPGSAAAAAAASSGKKTPLDPASTTTYTFELKLFATVQPLSEPISIRDKYLRIVLFKDKNNSWDRLDAPSAGNASSGKDGHSEKGYGSDFYATARVSSVQYDWDLEGALEQQLETLKEQMGGYVPGSDENEEALMDQEKAFDKRESEREKQRELKEKRRAFEKRQKEARHAARRAKGEPSDTEGASSSSSSSSSSSDDDDVSGDAVAGAKKATSKKPKSGSDEAALRRQREAEAEAERERAAAAAEEKRRLDDIVRRKQHAKLQIVREARKGRSCTDTAVGVTVLAVAVLAFAAGWLGAMVIYSCTGTNNVTHQHHHQSNTLKGRPDL